MGIRCQQCGRENPAGVRFCADPACGAYLPWDGQPDTGERQPDVPATVVVEQRAGIRIGVAPAEVAVEPGGKAEATVTIANTGSKVEGLRLVLDGPAAAWTRLSAREVSVYPENEATVTVTFAPPRAPSVPAGRTWFGVRAVSEVNPGLSAGAESQVEVGPFHRLAAELIPVSSRGRGGTTHTVLVHNQGNVAEPVVLAAGDPDGTLRTELAPRRTSVLPGQLPARLRLFRRRWFGRSESVPFQVVVTPDRGTEEGPPPIRLAGVRTVVLVIPLWLLPVLLALVVLAGGLVAAAKLRDGGQDGGGNNGVAATGATPGEVVTPPDNLAAPPGGSLTIPVSVPTPAARRVTVRPVVGSCDEGLAVTFQPAQAAVVGGREATFTATARVDGAARRGSTLRCAVEFVLSGAPNPPKPTQDITVRVI